MADPMRDVDLSALMTVFLDMTRERTPEEREAMRELGLGRYVMDPVELRSRRVDLRAGIEEHDPIPLDEAPDDVEAIELAFSPVEG
jgi:hypothetical protein